MKTISIVHKKGDAGPVYLTSRTVKRESWAQTTLGYRRQTI